MKEFFTAALPWVVMGVSIAVLAANAKKKEIQKTYITEGMCLGMCAGITVSSVGAFGLATGITLGMLVGEAIGLMIEKR